MLLFSWTGALHMENVVAVMKLKRLKKIKIKKAEKEKVATVPKEKKAMNIDENRIEELLQKLECREKDLKIVLDKIEISLNRILRENVKIIKKIESTINKFDNKMQDNTETIVEAEETLRNVLVAIRQNEYLQAWYPAQRGYPEMKVIGKHPGKYD